MLVRGVLRSCRCPSSTLGFERVSLYNPCSDLSSLLAALSERTGYFNSDIGPSNFLKWGLGAEGKTTLWFQTYGDT